MKKKQIIKIVGLILTATSIVFLFRRMISLDINVRELLIPANASMVLLISLLDIVLVFLNSFCWRLCLALFSTTKPQVSETFSAYARANIMKYLPGNVGHYAGRQFYGIHLGLKHIQIAFATVLELLYSTLSMILCAVSFSAKRVLQVLQEQPLERIYAYIGVAAFFVLTICVGLFIFRKNGYVHTFLELIGSCCFWRVFSACTLLNAMGAIFVSLQYIILLSPNIELNLELLMLLFSSNFVAIFVGYITPGVPGGIGVREMVLTVILSPYFPEGYVILAAFSQRIAIISADLLAVPASSLIVRYRQRQAHDQNQKK